MKKVTRIDTLTEEQKAQMEPWAKKWIEIGLRTGETDWDTFDKYMPVCYEKAGLKYPTRVVRVSSPLVGALAASIASAIWEKRATASVSESIDASVGSSVHSSVGESVDSSVHSSVGESVDSSVHSSVGESVRSSVDSSVGESVRSSVGESVDSSVHSSVGESVDSSVGESVYESVDSSVYESVDSSVGESVYESVDSSVYESVHSSVDSSVGESVYASVYESVRESVHSSVYASVRASVDESVDESVRESVHSSVYASVYASVDSSVGKSVYASVDSSVRTSVRASVYESVRESVDSSVYASVYEITLTALKERERITKKFNISPTWNNWMGGQFWVGGWWYRGVAFVNFFFDICGLKLSKDIMERATAYRKVCESVNYIWPNRNFIMVCARPKKISRNAQGRLHDEHGKAIEYPDGWGIYALNGVRFPEELYLRVISREMTMDEVLKIADIDQRVQAMKFAKSGLREFYLSEDGKKIDERLKFDAKGRPVKYELWRVPAGKTFSKDVHFAIYDCPSAIERGEKREYAKGVPEYATIAEAMAWGMSSDTHKVSAKEWMAMVPLVNES